MRRFGPSHGRLWAAGVLATILGPGCAALLADQNPAPTPQTTNVSYVKPIVEFAEGSRADVEKDGVKFIVAAEPFIETKKTMVSVTPLPTTFVMNNKYQYRVEQQPSFTVSPTELRLKVRVVNNLPHVLKLAGAVVSYTASGKQLPVPKSSYEELLGGIIRPRQEMEFTIVGPSTDQLPQTTNLSFTLDDVVVATDPAGNPSKRTSFEWIFAIEKKTVSQPAAVEASNVAMTQAEYEAMIGQLRQQGTLATASQSP